jgi:prephenate dehydratase
VSIVSRLAYFGPQGTFTEQAARAFDEGADLLPLPTIPHVVAAVRSGEARFGCVPIENSVEGSVSATMDALAVDQPVVVIAEHVLPIRFSLLARPGTEIADIGTVASHPHALAQVQSWLRAHLPDAEQRVSSSTAGAAVGVLDGQFDAAITAPVAATRYPLDVLATDIADVADAMTRFLLLALPEHNQDMVNLVVPAVAARTSVIIVVSHRPGELAAMLSELSLRGINISRIESRPLPGRFGEYRFYLDFDGHIRDERVSDALAALHRRSQEVRFLGSYPKADGAAFAPVAGTLDSDYEASAAWVSALRRGEQA